MDKPADRLKTQQERALGTLTLVAGGFMWAMLALIVLVILVGGDPRAVSVVTLYVFYGLGIALFIWISAQIMLATAFGNWVLLGPQQYPHLHRMVLEGAERLGLSPAPKAFLYNSNGLLNAFARRLAGGRYVFLTSALVEASSDEQVRFVIGHELGHHAAGHLNPWLHLLRMPSHSVPFLYPAYSRAREFTCDRIGAHLVGDGQVSQSALMMLGCGCGRLNGAMNCEAFAAQEAMVPPVFGLLTEIFRSHPRLTRRVLALRQSGAMFGD